MRNLLGHNCKVAALFEGTDCWFRRLDSILLKVKAKLRNKNSTTAKISNSCENPAVFTIPTAFRT